jgi:fructokinase
MKPWALGIDLGGTKTEAVLFDNQDAEVWRCRVATPGGSYAHTVQMIASLVDAAQQAANQAAKQATPGQHFTIGMGTPGSLAAGGLMKNCNSTCLNGMPLQRDVQAAIGRSVALANDANCLALSEATDGAAAGAGVVFAAILGTGTGAGIAVHGRVLQGPNSLAGEWGHNPLPWGEAGEDPPWHCYCGQRGCVENLVSGPGIAREHAALHGGSLDAASIATRALQGDAQCSATLQRHARRLARALASVINLLDPDVIVLGGGLSRMAHLYNEVPALWGRWVFAAGVPGPVHTRLLPALHGDASGVRGAAWLGRAAAPQEEAAGPR